LFEQYLNDLEKQREDSKIFRCFLDNKDESYRANTPAPEIVRDYIAGMTDEYFLKECNKLLFPRRLGSEF
jgi:dGTPase